MPRADFMKRRAARLAAGLGEVIGRWARRRQGEDVLPVTLAARRIYILPTRAGLGFAALLFAMLLAGLNYGNSLALFLTFLLGGFALVAMHQCHRILLGLQVTALDARAVFAGDTARLAVALANPTPRAKLELRAAAPASSAALDIAACGSGLLFVPLPTQRRGRLQLQRVEISSTAPFGLFRAWAWLHVPIEVIVYPRPAGNRSPPVTSGENLGQRLAGQGDDEWIDLRAFRQGDSPRQVAWKAYARGAPLLVREYRALGAQTRLFDLAQLDALPLEPRLQQLARWIVDAEARGERYGLRLPQLRIETGSGPLHRHRCLAALALHDQDRMAVTP
jgi:uncharacterized protein (DUF58 family)